MRKGTSWDCSGSWETDWRLSVAICFAAVQDAKHLDCTSLGVHRKSYAPVAYAEPPFPFVTSEPPNIALSSVREVLDRREHAGSDEPIKGPKVPVSSVGVG